MSKNVLLLYPNQLYAAEYLPKDVNQVVLIEEPLLFGTDSQFPMYMHKQKLVFYRASMRRYVEEVLWPAGYEVEYVEFSNLGTSDDIANSISSATKIEYFELNDDILSRRLGSAINGLANQPEVNCLDSPNFFLDRQEVVKFFGNKKQSTFTDFYRWQRERFNVLINPETYKPEGGKLSFEADERKRLPKKHTLPSFQVFGSNPYVEEAKEYVQSHFANNPGSIDDFPWPTNYNEASVWLEEFLENRLEKFGPYEDAIDGESPWIYHSALSTVLNAGIMQPGEVIRRSLEANDKKPLPISSLESFIRQILGWREYMRGVYMTRHVQLRATNSLGHNRRLTNDWYHGTTGIPPVDDVIKKVLTRGYSHHAERLMVVGNIMLLCDFHPDEVYRWFMEMHIDAFDWVVVPNVYGMSQYSDGGSMISKPFASSSNYVLKMSHYEKGDWCDVWDGLYWRFIEKNRDRFKSNPKMAITLNQLDKISEEHRRIIGYRADDFLENKTQT